MQSFDATAHPTLPTLLESVSHMAVPQQPKLSSLDTRKQPTRDQFEIWRDQGRSFGTIERPEPSEAPFHGRMENYLTSLLGYTRLRAAHPSDLRRDQRAIDRGDFDGIGLQYRLSGQETANSFLSGGLFTPGQIRILDLTQPFFSSNTSYDNIGFTVSRKQLTDRLPGVGLLHGILLPEGAMTLLLKEHMVSVMKVLPKTTPLEAEKLSEVTLEVLAATLLSTKHPDILSSDAASGALVQAVRLCIERNLHCPDLSPDFIAKAVGVSRAKLYRVCRAYGSPMEMLQYRRMRRAMEIMKANPALSTIEVALSVGYENRETFSRAFRREFGFSARDFQQSYRSGIHS